GRLRGVGRGGGAAGAGAARRRRPGAAADGRDRPGRRDRLRGGAEALVPGPRPRPLRRPAPGLAGEIRSAPYPRRHPGGGEGMTASARILLASPVFNEATHLEKTARAPPAQPLPPARWVVVDDGSRDDPLELARRLAAEI